MTEQITLYKERSYAACISEGFKFFVKNLRPICFAMMPYMVFISVIALSINLLIMKTDALLASQDITAAQSAMLMTFALMLLTVVIALFANARLFLVLRQLTGAEPVMENQARWIVRCRQTLRATWSLVRRSLPYVMAYALIIVAVGLLSALCAISAEKLFSLQGRSMQITIIAISLILLVITAMVCTPLTYSFYHHMMTEERLTVQNMKSTYRQGARYIWKIIGVSLLTLFITLVLTIILNIPSQVIQQAYSQYLTDSIQLIDNVSLPSGTFLCLALLASLSSAIVMLLQIPNNTVMLFLYGDIYSKTHTSDNTI